MTVIREDDFVQSVADALQFISYYHPIDYIEHLGRAYEREQSPAAKDATTCTTGSRSSANSVMGTGIPTSSAALSSSQREGRASRPLRRSPRENSIVRRPCGAAASAASSERC